MQCMRHGCALICTHVHTANGEELCVNTIHNEELKERNKRTRKQENRRANKRLIMISSINTSDEESTHILLCLYFCYLYFFFRSVSIPNNEAITDEVWKRNWNARRIEWFIFVQFFLMEFTSKCVNKNSNMLMVGYKIITGPWTIDSFKWKPNMIFGFEKNTEIGKRRTRRNLLSKQIFFFL